jgi:hypothetical protein
MESANGCGVESGLSCRRVTIRIILSPIPACSSIVAICIDSVTGPIIVLKIIFMKIHIIIIRHNTAVMTASSDTTTGSATATAGGRRRCRCPQGCHGMNTRCIAMTALQMLLLLLHERGKIRSQRTLWWLELDQLLLLHQALRYRRISIP